MITAADLIDEHAGGVMERPVPFISRVRLENYKSIESCDVWLSPLTVLVGPNGSGKSNFLDALSFTAAFELVLIQILWMLPSTAS